MADQRLDIRQQQSLVMTPQLQQSLKLLQYSTFELQEFIEQHLEKNPLLSVDEGEGDASEPQEQSSKEDSRSDDLMEKQENINSDTELDISLENTYTNDSNADVPEGQSAYYENANGGGSGYNSAAPDLEQTISESITLKDYMLEQIYLDFKSLKNRIIAAHLVDLLNDAGYIEDPDFKGIAKQLQCKERDVSDVLKRLQKCDPVGVFARNLPECLALQLKERNLYDPAMRRFLENLDLMAKGDFKKLQKVCGVDEEDLNQMITEIRSLNPKPGSDFESSVVQTIQHDIFVRRKKDATWTVELNSDALPKLLLDRHYYAEIKKRARTDDEKKYISEQYSDANWLVKSLNQRAETIMKVAIELVQQQNDFFEKGIAYLKPLTLRHIAEKIEVHESTVGRVTQGKYMATPRGVFELKFFFTSAVHDSDGGDEVSSTSVKHLIKELIDQEKATGVLSDDKLVDLLQDKGIAVARRTVAKYREAMHIPSSVQRRRQKKINAGA